MSEHSTVVVYSTRNGSTERYAQWIAEDCGADLMRAGETSLETLLRYETIIYGGCVYQGTIRGAELIRKNLDRLQGKQLLLFAVGLTHPADDAAFELVLSRNFSTAQQQGIRFFHFPGALDYAKMSFTQKFTLKLLVKNLMKRPAEERTEMENALVRSYGSGVDFTSRTYIKPLVQAVLTPQ